MEVEINLFSAFEDIVSPHNLATAMGIPHGAKLRLHRDNTGGQRAVSKIVLHCDKPTASRLRHRFSTSRAYVHAGRLTSLKFVGMRPAVTGHHLPAKALLLHQESAVAVASTAQLEPSGFPGAATAYTCSPSSYTRSPSSSYEVQAALEMIDRDEAAYLRVPGISRLHREFQRGACGTLGGMKGVSTRRRRGRLAHANEMKTDKHSGRCGEGKLSGEVAARSSSSSGECDGCSSSEMKRGSSAHSFAWDDRHCLGRHEVAYLGRGQHNRRRRHRTHSRAWSDEEEGDREPKTQQHVIAAHRRRRHHQRQATAYTTRSVADVASALARISQEYSDAPRPVEITGVVSILAKMYADGAAFAGNRQRDLETLDRLGVATWSARIHPQSFRREIMGASEVGLREASKKAWEGWFRILWRVIGLVRNIADFGTFVQVYASAAERDRLRVPASAAAEVAAKGSCARATGGKGRGRRVSPPSSHHGEKYGGNDDDDHYYFRRKARPGSSSLSAYSRSPTRIDAGQDNKKAHDPIAYMYGSGRGIAFQEALHGAEVSAGKTTIAVDEIPQLPSQKLSWLFPVGHGDDGRRAFARHAICGDGVHGLVALEAAVDIVRDAGKHISMDRVWRWFCERSNGNNNVEAGGAKLGSTCQRGRFLRFEDFVELCDGLREHMEDVSILSDDAPKENTSNF